jgi:hypothetical protein
MPTTDSSDGYIQTWSPTNTSNSYTPIWPQSSNTSAITQIYPVHQWNYAPNATSMLPGTITGVLNTGGMGIPHSGYGIPIPSIRDLHCEDY